MCVAISLMPGATITEEEVYKMDRANADGVGIAWADGHIVQWHKTVNVKPEQVAKFVNYHANRPRLLHFRFATAGGTKVELCHPFEIGPLGSCKPSGRANRVMIHNGHWSRWDEVLRLMAREALLPDRGPWSDSRLAAFLAYHDPEWLDALGGKVAILDGAGQLTHRGDWQELREGIKVSNKSWDISFDYKRGGYSGYEDWKGWGWKDTDWEEYSKHQEERRAQRVKEYQEEKAKREQEKQKGEKADEETACAAVYDIGSLAPGATESDPGDAGETRGYGPKQATALVKKDTTKLGAAGRRYGGKGNAEGLDLWAGAEDGYWSDSQEQQWVWKNPVDERIYTISEGGDVVPFIQAGVSGDGVVRGGSQVRHERYDIGGEGGE